MSLFLLHANEAVVATRLSCIGRAPHPSECASTYPLWSCAAGHCLLSGLPPVARVEALPPEPYPDIAEGTVRWYSDLNQRITTGCSHGVFVDAGDLDPEVIHYAALVSRAPLLAVDVSVLRDAPANHTEQVKAALVALARP